MISFVSRKSQNSGPLKDRNREGKELDDELEGWKEEGDIYMQNIF